MDNIIREDGESAAFAGQAPNQTGAGVQNFDPLLGAKKPKKKLRDIVRRKTPVSDK